MTTQPEFRQFAVLKATRSLMQVYSSDKLSELQSFTQELLRGMGAPDTLLQPYSFRVASAPSQDWTLEVVGQYDTAPQPDRAVISYAFTDPDLLSVFRDLVLDSLEKPLDADGNAFLDIGADIGGTVADDHWCPGTADRAMFGHRPQARQVLNADFLNNNQLRGQNVNVVIFDQGLDRNDIPPANWGGGLNYLGTPPGSASRTSHGMLVARNVLNIAPYAVLYDVPMIPQRITDVLAFAISAWWTYFLILWRLPFLRAFQRWQGPWVFVNAWAIFDRSSELPLGDYTENTRPNGGHPLNNIVGQAVQQDLIDVIFAAGNCGQFCPSIRCGKLDRGPLRSIWGANSHFAVITAGAVRVDELWLGYSSQGPGQPLLRPPGQLPPNQKPDLCAPSQFREATDGYVESNINIVPPTDHPRTNTGTSTACALTAGVVAALRSNPVQDWRQARVSPGALKQRLIQTTRSTRGPGWSPRLGWGILDAEAAFNQLLMDYP
jgi:subtilisin family serine protease